MARTIPLLTLRRGLCACLCSAFAACTLNVKTDKPIDLNVVLKKPVEVKVAADVAVSKLPPIKTDVKVEMPKLFSDDKK